jgi:hypothetical protein
VHYHNEASLKAICKKGGGTSTSNETSYGCIYKNGNMRGCSRETKKCSVETPKRTTINAGVGGVPARGGVLDGGRGGSTGGVAYATITLECSGGRKYEVSTGTKTGECRNNGNGTASCTDTGGKNSSQAQCNAGCTSSSGAGSCTMKAQYDPPPKPPKRRPETGVLTGGGILDGGSGLGTQGPAATGTPLSPGRGSPPPGKIF